MGLLKNVWQGFAGGPDVNRQQTLKFLLEDNQVQVRLPYSNIATVEPPRVINFPYKNSGWFEENATQRKQHHCIHLYTECWYYMAPVLRFADGELGNLFCRLWLKRVPEGVNALDRQQLAEYVIAEHDHHYNAVVELNTEVEPGAPYDHGRGINTEIRQEALADAELRASRGSTHMLEHLEDEIESRIKSYGHPPLAPASIISLHGQDWVFYQDKQFQDSPDGADFYCLPLDDKYYFAISFKYTICQSGKMRWWKHAKATQQMVLDSLKVSPLDNTVDNLLTNKEQ